MLLSFHAVTSHTYASCTHRPTGSMTDLLLTVLIHEIVDQLGGDVNAGDGSEGAPTRDGVHFQDVPAAIRTEQQVHAGDRRAHRLCGAKGKPLLVWLQLHDLAAATLGNVGSPAAVRVAPHRRQYLSIENKG